MQHYNCFMALWNLSGTTWVSRYQKGKTRKVKPLTRFTAARDSEWQWHQLGHMQICTSPRQVTMPASHHSVFCRPDALPAANSIKALKAIITECNPDNICTAIIKTVSHLYLPYLKQKPSEAQMI